MNSTVSIIKISATFTIWVYWKSNHKEPDSQSDAHVVLLQCDLYSDLNLLPFQYLFL